MQEFDKETYRLLEKLYQVQKMEESELFQFVNHDDVHRLEPHSHFLLQQRMIRAYDVNDIPDGEAGHVGAKRFYEISLPGKAYVEATKKLRRKETVEWIRYIITTAIAVAALITAIVSIILQYI